MNPSGDIAGEGAAAAQEAAPGATGAPSDALHELRDAMRQFAAERAWEPMPAPCLTLSGTTSSHCHDPPALTMGSNSGTP